MPWINCTINLNSDSTGSFYTGDIVTGLVVLELEKDLKLERIDFKVVGICKASWTRSAPTMPYIKIYSEKKKVLNITMNDIFRETFRGKLIPAGVHRYPFHFALATDLPSTFESSLAKTQYYIKVKSKPNYKMLRNITYFKVLGNINLNHIEEMLEPCFQAIQKKDGGSDNFGISIKTYRAFAPKQTIPFEVTINNEKKIKIYKIKISLMQKLRYNVSSGHAENMKRICKMEHKKFSNNIAEICFLHMEIPQTVPSSLQVTEPMIDISYSFQIDVVFSFLSSLREEIPVTIASVPVIHSSF